MVNARDKGKRGEREFFSLMNELLGGIHFARNLMQSKQGGCDSDTDLPVAVEVKRQQNLNWRAAIRQAIAQAKAVNKLPVLAERRNNEPWTVHLILTPSGFARLLEQPFILESLLCTTSD